MAGKTACSIFADTNRKMNRGKVMKLKLLLIATGLLSLAACSPQAVKDGPTSTDDSSKGQASAQVGGLSGTGLGTGSALDNVSYERGAINDASSVLAEKVIYFEFDSDQISRDFIDLIAHHGKYLAANRDMQLRLEGHADERGTREYNVALGNRRAQAVRRLVLFQGVDASQLSMVSFGEEKPVALNHDEEAWHLNRRVELVYEAK
jgi:peptidoglycan-associated lipoprotein